MDIKCPRCGESHSLIVNKELWTWNDEHKAQVTCNFYLSCRCCSFTTPYLVNGTTLEDALRFG